MQYCASFWGTAEKRGTCATSRRLPLVFPSVVVAVLLTPFPAPGSSSRDCPTCLFTLLSPSPSPPTTPDTPLHKGTLTEHFKKPAGPRATPRTIRIVGFAKIVQMYYEKVPQMCAFLVGKVRLSDVYINLMSLHVRAPGGWD